MQETLHGDEEWIRDEHCGLYDAYEPTLMRDAILKMPSMCPLIVGGLWPSLASVSGIQWNGKLGTDPLSVYFGERNLFLCSLG